MSDKDSATPEGTQSSQDAGSNQGVGQQGSEQEFVTVAQFKELQKTLDTVSRQLQGDKDRAVKRTNERVDRLEGDLKSVLQNAANKGMNLSQLLDAVQEEEEQNFRRDMQSMVQAFQSGRFPTPQSGGSGSGQGVDNSEVLKELELDLNDTRVKEFAGKKFASKEQALIEGARLIKQISTRQPSEADQPAGTHDRTAAADKQTQLMQEYTEGSKNLRGQALINYKMAMRKKGLNIS